MPLLSTLGSLGRATATQLPGIMQRSRERDEKEANANFGADFHEALQSGDENAMNAAIQQYSGQASQVVIQKASEAVQTFKTDTREQEFNDLQLAIETAGTPEQKADARLSMWQKLNPDATPEILEQQRTGLLGMAQQERQLMGFGVRKAEAETKGVEAGAEGKRLTVDEAKRMETLRTSMSEAMATGDTTQAATFARLAGLETTAKALEGDTGEFNKEKFNAESKLMGDYTSLTEKFRQIRDAYARILIVGNNPSPAADLAMIFNYMKMLDPGSVVRESEFATAQNAAGVPELIRNTWNRILEGTRLGTIDPDERSKVREDFMNQSKNLYASQLPVYRRTVDTYSNIATRNQLNPLNVVFDQEIGDFIAQVEGGKFDASSEIFRNRQNETNTQMKKFNIKEGQDATSASTDIPEPAQLTPTQKKLKEQFGFVWDPVSGKYIDPQEA